MRRSRSTRRVRQTSPARAPTRGVRLLHVSTDYVFDGTQTRPYREDDPIAPLGVYGESKAAGEQAVRDAGGTTVRTSWLFEAKGPSFVHTMLRLAKERPVLRVVADQHGCPTWADDLADAPVRARRESRRSSPSTTTATPSRRRGTRSRPRSSTRPAPAPLAPIVCERIDPITTADYPTPAQRPAYSVLDTARIRALGIVAAVVAARPRRRGRPGARMTTRRIVVTGGAGFIGFNYVRDAARGRARHRGHRRSTS